MILTNLFGFSHSLLVDMPQKMIHNRCHGLHVLIEVNQVFRIAIIDLFCHNIGYFSRIRTESEAMEKPLEYMQVMARPMVLSREGKRPIRWTSPYPGKKVSTLARYRCHKFCI